MNQDQAPEFLRNLKDGQKALERAANYLLDLERNPDNENLRKQTTEILALIITELERPVIAKFPNLNAYR
jgi:hypothetical protein